MTREVAFEILERVQTDDAYANLLFPKLVERYRLSPRDAAFVQELSFGTIRNWSFYEEVIQHASSRSLSEIEQNAQIILVLGVHQLLDMRVPTHAAINESVNLAKVKSSKGSVGFVNAVLRKIAQKSRLEWLELVTSNLAASDYLSVAYSHPAWIVQSLKAALASRRRDSELEHLLESNNNPARVSVAVLPGFAKKEEIPFLDDSLAVSPIGLEVSGNPGAIEAIREGRARVQDQGSQLVTLALVEADCLTQDESWLDVCAGPGGKAALLAALSKNKNVSLVFNEASPHRAKLVEKALEPLGSFKVLTGDGRDFGKQGAKFSRILLDAPCTGLGALRRRPEARWRRSQGDLSNLVKLQKELLESSWQALKPGGVLAYVTCSPHLSETTAQIAWAQSKFGTSLELLDATSILKKISPQLELEDSYRTVQLWPHLHGTDAMFLALMRKSIN